MNDYKLDKKCFPYHLYSIWEFLNFQKIDSPTFMGAFNILEAF